MGSIEAVNGCCMLENGCLKSGPPQKTHTQNGGVHFQPTKRNATFVCHTLPSNWLGPKPMSSSSDTSEMSRVSSRWGPPRLQGPCQPLPDTQTALPAIWGTSKFVDLNPGRNLRWGALLKKKKTHTPSGTPPRIQGFCQDSRIACGWTKLVSGTSCQRGDYPSKHMRYHFSVWVLRSKK